MLPPALGGSIFQSCIARISDAPRTDANTAKRIPAIKDQRLVAAAPAGVAARVASSIQESKCGTTRIRLFRPRSRVSPFVDGIAKEKNQTDRENEEEQRAKDHHDNPPLLIFRP